VAIKDTLSYYLQRTGPAQLDQISVVDLKRIFLLMIKTYKNEEISLDTLSTLAGEIWTPPSQEDAPDVVELKEAVDACSELNFYMRKIPEISTADAVVADYLKKIFEYYAKNMSGD
jgi:hypothetical protein